MESMRRSPQAAVQFNLRVLPEVDERITAESTAAGVDKSTWIREAIRERFERIDRSRKEELAAT
jgi:predicted HicB family RNase H-like nuclease